MAADFLTGAFLAATFFTAAFRGVLVPPGDSTAFPAGDPDAVPAAVFLAGVFFAAAVFASGVFRSAARGVVGEAVELVLFFAFATFVGTDESCSPTAEFCSPATLMAPSACALTGELDTRPA
ncbi:hypothetical protein [Streptomyces sp. NPDC096153]|uniref:hypothetical protein n=1 Tax=Streptomyces sp. NPDC096153 TaxID=3155548 RepID=UPI00332E71E2